ncbi:MAG: polysaccharide biosynthesis/export family protein, partial [Halothece sp. Uz-M2-17]|nr:polysaccharide biosynthesis/export family protein [Halothece sp. Uz-M2-17]
MITTQYNQTQQKPENPMFDWTQLSSRWLLMVFTTIMTGCLGTTLSVQAQDLLELQEPTAESDSSSVETSVETLEVPFYYQETPYTLGPGDTIGINIFYIPEYSGEYRVSVDGIISLPIVGSVDVQGLTIAQVNELITQRYATILKRPLVSVTLVQPRPIRVAIAGEVYRPGSYDLSSAGEQKFPPITEAIKQAGGITRSANVREIELHRIYRGEPYVLNVNLWKLV